MGLVSKNYKKWMSVKAKLQEKHLSDGFKVGYKEGDVFWMSLGENVGFEEDGKGDLFLRPVLVLKGISRTLFYGIPLSSQVRRGRFYRRIVIKGKMSVLLLNQIRPFDTARIEGRRYDRISQEDLWVIKRMVKAGL